MRRQSYQTAEQIAMMQPGGFQRSCSGFRIPCPAHGGEDKNLSIWNTPSGGFGARCWSQGCTYKDIMKALGVSYSGRRQQVEPIATYQHPDRRERPRFRLDYPYDYEAGKPCTYTNCGKTTEHKHIWGKRGLKSAGCYLLSWGEDAPGDTLVIVEGEKAAAALRDYDIAGYTPVSYYGGSQMAGSADYSLCKGRDVIIWPDNDDAGLKAAEIVAEMASDVGAASISMVNVDGLSKGYDAADVSPEVAAELIWAAKLYELPQVAPTQSYSWLPEYPYHKDPWRLTDDSACQRMLTRYAENLLVVYDKVNDGDCTLYVDNGFGVWIRDKGLFEDMLRTVHIEWLDDYRKSGELVKKNFTELRDIHKFADKTETTDYRNKIRKNVASLRTHWHKAGNKPPDGLTFCEKEETDPVGYIGCENGVVDLNTKQLLPPAEARKKLVTKTTKLDFKPDAAHPDIEKVFGHLPADNRRWLLEAAGYALRGQPSRRFYFVRGETGGGKSTILSLMGKAVGQYGDTIPSGALLPNKNQGGHTASPHLSFAQECRFAYDSDMPAGALDRSVVASIAGGDEIKSRELFQNFTRSRPSQATMFISMNYGKELKVGADDDAMFARMRVLHFPSRPEADLELNLKDRLKVDKRFLEALLAELVQHCGSAPPEDTPSIASERKEWRREEVGDAYDFLKHCLVKDGKHSIVFTKEIYDCAKSFAETEDKPYDMTQRTMTGVVKSLHGLDAVKQMRRGGTRGRGWSGYRLLTVDEINAVIERGDEEIEDAYEPPPQPEQQPSQPTLTPELQKQALDVSAEQTSPDTTLDEARRILFGKAVDKVHSVVSPLPLPEGVEEPPVGVAQPIKREEFGGSLLEIGIWLAENPDPASYSTKMPRRLERKSHTQVQEMIVQYQNGGLEWQNGLLLEG